MQAPMPPDAERVTLGGETAWVWATGWDTEIGRRRVRGSGWSVLQGPYLVYLRNIERDGKPWHTIDWLNGTPKEAAIEGGLARNEPGHMENRAEFLEHAERIVAVLRRRDAPPIAPTAARTRAIGPVILGPEKFKPTIDRFNAEDSVSAHIETSIPNDQAWEFLSRNIPWFECPDAQIQETYYYRWWCFRKHLSKTPAGWVITEFLPPVGWASKYNTISCAAGHHLYEARWLRDPAFAADYASFWLLPEASPRNYSFWAADAVRAVTLATGDLQLAYRLLPNLIANYEAWARSNQDPDGLFHQIDDRDGMEYSLGGSGYRPSINSYMYGDAMAISSLASRTGSQEIAGKFGVKAQKLRRLIQDHLWSPRNQFFETVEPKSLRQCGIREEIGFIPWYFNLPGEGYEAAWQQLLDPYGLAAPFGPLTVEKRAAGFMHPENHDCLWNGPSWPYATTQTLVAAANLLSNYHQSAFTSKHYFELLKGYSRSQRKDGRPWIAEDLDGETGHWIVDLPRSVCYNHSGFADLIITGLVGLRPRADDQIQLNPLLPAGEWPWFCLDGIPYHGHSLTVLWDADGSHYGKGAGLSFYADGNMFAQRKDLGPLSASFPHQKKMSFPARWTKYEGGPVLGGSLGTCFDVSLLEDDRKYKMYFSWRSKQSVALVESDDGIHWGEPTILIGPAKTGWEDDINRPCVVKRDGIYHMWYTGQFNDHSSIGYATSSDGLTWERRSKPVLEAVQPWEKVAVMCPSVLWDKDSKRFRMWYSGGEQYEPDAIGYATSPDGVTWTKHEGPIFEADPANRWEQYKVTACQVLEWQGWHYMFYIGFRDIDHAQIGIARSKDGVTSWERLRDNPIVSPTVDGWDADACYKPFALFDKAKDQWMLWYNGRNEHLEQIGLVTKPGPDLGFG